MACTGCQAFAAAHPVCLSWAKPATWDIKRGADWAGRARQQLETPLRHGEVFALVAQQACSCTMRFLCFLPGLENSGCDGWESRSREVWCGGKLAQRQEGGREEREKQRPRAGRDQPRAPFSLRLPDPSLSAPASSGNSTKGHSAIWLPRALSFPAGHSLAFSHKVK